MEYVVENVILAINFHVKKSFFYSIFMSAYMLTTIDLRKLLVVVCIVQRVDRSHHKICIGILVMVG